MSLINNATNIYFNGNLIDKIYLNDNIAWAPTPTPSTTPSITPSISISVTPSVTPSISVSITPTVTPSVSISSTPSTTPSISISSTPSVTPSVSVSVTPSISVSIIPSINISNTPSVSKTPSVSITPSRTPSVSVTPSKTVTPTLTPSTSPDTDSIRAQLTSAQKITYDAAAVGDWIKVTSTQYNNIVNNVIGATKKGNSDVQINTREVLTSFTNTWIAFGSTGVPSFQINNGEYVIAMITEAWNQSGGTSQLAYTTAFTGSVVANIGGTAGPSSGGNRDYFIRKAPTDTATETRYPVLTMSVSPNAVSNWPGFRSTNNGATWLSASNNQIAKIQIITTSTKSW